MVVEKRQQMLAAIDAPLLRSELAVERIGKLPEVLRIDCRIQAFVVFIVGAAVEHPIVDQQIIIPEQHLSDEREIRLQTVAERAQGGKEIAVE